MKIDLRYDIGKDERFINVFPWFRLGLVLYFGLLVDIIIFIKKKLRKEI